jgi:hypothetical protein
MTLAEIEARRAARKEAAAQAKAEQYAKDLEALDALEEEYGAGKVTSLEVAFYSPGLPTMAIVRAPKGIEYKRLRDRARSKNSDPGLGADELADVCVVYPEPDVYKQMRETFPGIHDSAFVAANKLAEGKAKDEGKD